jgi:hypothetical protein
LVSNSRHRLAPELLCTYSEPFNREFKGLGVSTVSKQLGPIEICCDAPPYWIVRACHELGVRAPEDVRWLRMSAFRCQKPVPARSVAAFVAELFRGPATQPSASCTCGARLPELNASLIVVEEGEAITYRLGQCARCRTVFWDES